MIVHYNGPDPYNGFSIQWLLYSIIDEAHTFIVLTFYWTNMKRWYLLYSTCILIWYCDVVLMTVRDDDDGGIIVCIIVMTGIVVGYSLLLFNIVDDENIEANQLLCVVMTINGVMKWRDQYNDLDYYWRYPMASIIILFADYWNTSISNLLTSN